jgi:hypothetical protein
MRAIGRHARNNTGYPDQLNSAVLAPGAALIRIKRGPASRPLGGCESNVVRPAALEHGGIVAGTTEE